MHFYVRRLFVWPLIIVLLTACANQGTKPIAEQSVRQLESELTTKHPSAYFYLARGLFNRGDKDEAVLMYYVGQIRYRAYINTLTEGEAAEEEQTYDALKEEIGDDVNIYAAEDLDNWIALLDKAVEWHKKHPNEFLPTDEYSLLYEMTLYNFKKLRDYIAENKALIRQKRAAQGLENR